LRNEKHGDAIRAIRSDNGSEFRNSRFGAFCHDLGLEHQFSSPYTPPQNGVVLKDRYGEPVGGSEWEPIKILLEGDGNSNKMNTASNTRLRLTT
jgi:transposase InsO family protein